MKAINRAVLSDNPVFLFIMDLVSRVDKDSSGTFHIIKEKTARILSYSEDF